MKLLIGNFKGPKGEPGNIGQTGAPGPKGEPGNRGSRWTSGTAITGINTAETIFADSGITDAAVDDYYINTTTGNLYQCTASGDADAAKWVYIGNFKGPQGNPGPAGSISDINDQIPTYTEATQIENIESGETVKIAFGKLKKALSVFIVHHTQKATAAILGHVKLSNSAAITKAGEYALDAIEKNATIDGTLAHLIASQNSDLTNSINQINSNLNKQFLNDFDVLLDAYGIDKNIVFNHMYELNALLPRNIHTFCTINTDFAAQQLVNVMPTRYGILEIIKGQHGGFCTFILYASTVEETYVYTSRYRNEIEESSDKWRKVMWEYVN